MIKNNLRKRARISYYEPEEHDLDEYIFCSECGDYVVEYCVVHGALLVIPDNKVTTESTFSPQIPHAALTIPDVFLHIAPSVIPGAGLGVFTTLALPADVRFGPYVGDINNNVASPYCWQIHSKNRTIRHVVDAANPNRSNWMRYVNCSRHWNEQNLLAFQYRGQIYYRTLNIIPRNTELLVYYGTEYAKELGIDIRGYNDPRKYVNYITKTVARDHTAAVYTNSSEEEVPSKRLHESNPQKEDDIIKIHFETDTVTFEEVTSNTRQYFKENTDYNFNNLTNTIINEYNGSELEQILGDSTIGNVNNLFDSDSNINENQFNNSVNNFINKNSEEKHNNDMNNFTATTDGNTKINNTIVDTEYTNTMYRLTEKGYIQCQICNYQTYLEASIKKHVKLHDPSRQFECNICHYKYIDRYSLKTHFEGVHEKFHCKICNMKFSRPIYLQKHLVKIHNDSGQNNVHNTDVNIMKIPDTENSDLSSNDSLQKAILYDLEINKDNMHFNNEIETTKYFNAKCTICSFSTQSKDHFKRHLKLHDENRLFPCHLCNFRYSNQFSLKRHISTVHKSKNVSCSKEVKTDILIDHINVETKKDISEFENITLDDEGAKNTITPVITSKCTKDAVTNIDTLSENNNQIDANENKDNIKENNITDLKYTENLFHYQCHNCDYKTPSEYAIRRHVLIHDFSRKHVCDKCHYRFKAGHLLLRHIKAVHYGEKPYKCAFCEAKYACSQGLERHVMKVHSLIIKVD